MVVTSSDVDTVRQGVRSILEGLYTSEQLVKDRVAKIDEGEAQIGAWQYLARDQALEQSRLLDEIRRRGQPTGDLHGIPVGVKDIIDTSDMPTERGTPIHAQRRPAANSAVVEKLRESGAVILGKTVTTEFAYLHPARTRNPCDLDHSPGGSSSGSAAAVAAGHVDLSIGTQTNGSTIRPASYCGVYGFKPTRGIISRRGVLQTSVTLDQIGVFGRDAGDVAFLADVLAGYDAADEASYLAPRPRMLRGYQSQPPIEPNFAWFDLSYADRYSEATRLGCEELIEALGGQLDRLTAPDSFNALLRSHLLIQDYELFRCLEVERTTAAEQLSETISAALERASGRTETQYHDALETMASAERWFRQFFNDYDAIVTPSAPTEAPPLGEGTGDPICCTIWTLCGLPCLSIPLLTGRGDLPIGVQLIGAANEDDRLFRTARWLLGHLRGQN